MNLRLIVLGCVMAAAGQARAADPPRPNIIIVMPDDIGYGDWACLGNPIVHTPNVDKLHAESVRLTDFHVSPTCAPTRASLMTGRHEFKSGVTHTIYERERLSLRATTLAQVLKSAGYATGIFGKWHLGDEAAYQPEKRGFDEVFIHGAGGIGQTYPGSGGDAPGNRYTDPAILHNGKFVKTKGFCTDVFFDQAIAWMDARRKQDGPFFTYITPNAAHAPLDVPEAMYARYQGKIPDDAAKFYGMVTNIDDNMGKMMGRLREWSLDQNTLVIFLTDNGGTAGVRVFNAGMRGSKGTPYEGGTRVPCFWRWPGHLPSGLDIDVLTSHQDILPTLADIAGANLSIAANSQIEGRDLLPLLKGDKVAWPDRTYVTHVGRWPRGEIEAYKYRGCSIRDERYSLVNNAELYDLKADPGEAKNVIADHPDEVARLRAAYEAWWADILPRQENEYEVGPKINPFKALYWSQFGGGPDAELLKRMDPTRPRDLPAAKKKAARKKAGYR